MVKHCKNCKKIISQTAIYCKSCANKGKNNPNYKHGKTYNNKCKDCNKLIDYKAIRCHSCAEKYYLSTINVHPRYIHGYYSRCNKHFCIDCGQELRSHTKSKRCKKCSNIYNSIKLFKHGHYSKHHKNKQKCIDCNKKIWGDSKRCHSCENKRRYKEGIMNNKGINNGQYIHGQDLREYPKEFSKELKHEIFQRDDYTCKKCNIYPCNDLTVHHIDYNKLNNNKNNLITLCRKCNCSVNKNRFAWELFFKSLIDIK